MDLDEGDSWAALGVSAYGCECVRALRMRFGPFTRCLHATPLLSVSLFSGSLVLFT